MKKSIFTLALAFIALFAANTVSAQSLSQYTADFANKTLTLNITKIGGFGSKTAFIKVDLYLEIEGTVDCQKINKGVGTMYRTFNRDAVTVDDYIVVPRGTKNGSLTTNKTIDVVASGLECPGGWSFDQREGQDINAIVTRAWVVVTQLNSSEQPISVPQVQDLVVSGLPLAQ